MHSRQAWYLETNKYYVKIHLYMYNYNLWVLKTSTCTLIKKKSYCIDCNTMSYHGGNLQSVPYYNVKEAYCYHNDSPVKNHTNLTFRKKLFFLRKYLYLPYTSSNHEVFEAACHDHVTISCVWHRNGFVSISQITIDTHLENFLSTSLQNTNTTKINME